jgi:flagellar basal-body rod protein FlgB
VIDRLFSRNKLIEKALDASWLRNEAISQNIANVDTPGYKRKTVPFEQLLNEAIEGSSFKGFRTDRRHIPIGNGDMDNLQLNVMEDNASLSYRLDGNNVDIDNEMASMAKNTIQYNTLIQRMNSRFKTLKSVISEGRR